MRWHGARDRWTAMSCPIPISISPPWSAPREGLRRGNAGGNARSTECSPLGNSAFCRRAADMQCVHRVTGACNSRRQRNFERPSTGGVLCRPAPHASAPTGATTQRGRERPPSQARQVPCRLTPEGRSRPRCAPVRTPGMRSVMTSPQRHVMAPASTPPVSAPRARHGGGRDTVSSRAKESPCL
jgi:hypothetical protein